MDPWRDCERIYDTHFADRMSQRFLPFDQVREALKDGDKSMQKKGEYKVKWKRWTIEVSMEPCFLYLWTAYLD